MFVAHVARYISEFVQRITIIIWVSICEHTLLLFSLISHLLCLHDGFLHLSFWKFGEFVMVSVIFGILVLISCCGDTTIITNSPLSMNGFVFWLTINKHFCCSLLLALFQWWTVTRRVCASCWMNRTVPTSQTLLTLRDSEWSAFPLLAFFFSCPRLFQFVQSVCHTSSSAGLLWCWRWRGVMLMLCRCCWREKPMSMWPISTAWLRCTSGWASRCLSTFSAFMETEVCHQNSYRLYQWLIITTDKSIK